MPYRYCTYECEYYEYRYYSYKYTVRVYTAYGYVPVDLCNLYCTVLLLQLYSVLSIVSIIGYLYTVVVAVVYDVLYLYRTSVRVMY